MMINFKIMLKQIYYSVFFVFSSFILSAQQIEKCHTTEMTEKYIQIHPEVQKHEDNYFQQVLNIAKKSKLQSSDTNLRIIPVVFHVIHNDGSENISKAQIQDQIKILNEDYRRLNADTVNTNTIFKSIAVDSKIEFRLAAIDPDGNCTDGIVRVRSSLTDNAGDNVKDLSWWDNSKYLNIWVVMSIDDYGSGGTILGYAYFPFMGVNDPSIDGIIIRSDCIGDTGTAVAFGEKGRTLTHEIGHYLGLYHTFQGGCSGSGDGIDDTPPVASASYGCLTGNNSCSTDSPDLVDQIENYLDYSNGDCMNMFTQDQKLVFDNTFIQYRSNLISASNLIATGVADGMQTTLCAPHADFGFDKEMICEGGKISFNDISWNGTTTSWQWNFQGGSPYSSSDSAPIIEYDTAGMFSVTLKAINSTGSDTCIRTSIIHVNSITAKYTNSYFRLVDF